MICSIRDCANPHYGRGFCKLHYQRWRAHGDPLTVHAPLDLAGQRFGRLTVVRLLPGHGRRWLCICECGAEHTVAASNLCGGSVRSCGCLARELTSGRSRTHGQSRLAEYRIWGAMRRRCTPGHSNALYHGDRGIALCERWHDFEAFLADMGFRPSADHSLDRIDPRGPYAPDNCRWATREQQARNKTTTIRVSFRGESKCLADWAEDLGMPYGVLKARLYLGWSIERMLTEQPRRKPGSGPRRRPEIGVAA